jgi:hypothetical protein
VEDDDPVKVEFWVVPVGRKYVGRVGLMGTLGCFCTPEYDDPDRVISAIADGLTAVLTSGEVARG